MLLLERGICRGFGKGEQVIDVARLVRAGRVGDYRGEGVVGLIECRHRCRGSGRKGGRGRGPGTGGGIGGCGAACRGATPCHLLQSLLLSRENDEVIKVSTNQVKVTKIPQSRDPINPVNWPSSGPTASAPPQGSSAFPRRISRTPPCPPQEPFRPGRRLRNCWWPRTLRQLACGEQS